MNSFVMSFKGFMSWIRNTTNFTWITIFIYICLMICHMVIKITSIKIYKTITTFAITSIIFIREKPLINIICRWKTT
eukprot:UN06478